MLKGQEDEQQGTEVVGGETTLCDTVTAQMRVADICMDAQNVHHREQTLL